MFRFTSKKRVNAAASRFGEGHHQGACLDLRWTYVVIACAIWVFLRAIIPKEFLPRILQTATSAQIGHAFVYALITALVLFAVRRERKQGFLLMVFLGMAAISAVDELTEIWLDGTAGIENLTADVVGVAAVYLLLAIWCSHKPG